MGDKRWHAECAWGMAKDGERDVLLFADFSGVRWRTLTVDDAGTPNMPRVVLTSAYADQRLTDETQQGQSGGNGVAPKQITFNYNALDQLTYVSRYDFVGVGPMVDIATAGMSYDAANRLTNLAYTGDTGQIAIDAFAFTLDNANRITTRTSTVDGEADYGYDVTNQVTTAAYTGSGQPPNEAYSYTKCVKGVGSHCLTQRRLKAKPLRCAPLPFDVANRRAPHHRTPQPLKLGFCSRLGDPSMSSHETNLTETCHACQR